jgi:hypothetical protein
MNNTQESSIVAHDDDGHPITEQDLMTESYLGRAPDLYGVLTQAIVRNLIHSHAAFQQIWIKPFQ